MGSRLWSGLIGRSKVLQIIRAPGKCMDFPWNEKWESHHFMWILGKVVTQRGWKTGGHLVYIHTISFEMDTIIIFILNLKVLSLRKVY